MMSSYVADVILNHTLPWGAFWQKPEFWHTWLPTWMQGAATVFAAYVGWKAVYAWREQDATRRRADAAESLLMAAHRLADRILSARVSYPFAEKMTSLLERVAVNVESANALRSANDEFRVHMLRASPHLKNTGVEAAAKKLKECAWRMASTRNRVMGIKLWGHNENDADEVAFLEKEFKILVDHYGQKPPDNAMLYKADDFEVLVGERLSELESKLNPLITGS